MLPFIATIALLGAQDQPPRLRTVLDNGSIILVESMPKERVVSVQLFASSKHMPESAETHGYRHLLEHLIARGDGSLDRKMESEACFFKAETLRDAMQIEVTVGPNQLPLAMETLRSILRKPEIKQEAIDKELHIMRDELAMEEDPALLSSAAWTVAYGDAGLDPIGTFDTMYRATPEKLADVYDRQFAGDGLVVTIAGPIDIDKATATAKELLGPLPKGHFTDVTPVRTGKPGHGESSGFGECRGAIVPGFKSPQAVAALAAALAVASEVPHSFVIYTPTVRPGLVLVGHSDMNSGIGLFVDNLESAAPFFVRGRSMAREWVNRQMRSAEGVAYLRGLLLCQGEANRPESMLDQIDAMTPKQFEDAMAAFKSDRAAIAVGTK